MAIHDRWESHPPIGFNCVSWDPARTSGTTVWEQAIRDMHGLGVCNVALVTYRFVNGDTGAILPTSKHGLAAGPTRDALAAAIRLGKGVGMTVSLNPFIEVDNSRGIGSTWRGNLNFPTKADLVHFFIAYGAYIEEMADLARTAGADRLYVGSELAGLSRNLAARPLWTELIRRAREAFGGDGRSLAYAANHDEFKGVPFWEELDEIGVDAYFSLATRSEAAGLGNPAIATIAAHWQRELEGLQRFAKRWNRPLVISEWGTVPLDLTTYKPWDWRPSEIADPTEQLNAYQATLEVVRSQGRWLAGIDFWHWRMPGNEGSLYGIAADSQVGRLIGRLLSRRDR